MNIQTVHLLNFMEYARIRGVTEQQMKESIKYPPVDWQDAYSLVAADDFYAVLHLVVGLLKDDLLGIRLGQFMQLKALGLVYQISLQATTVEEGLYYLRNYLAVSLPLIHMDTSLHEKAVSVVLQIDNEHTFENRIILENVLMLMARELRMMAGDHIFIHLLSPYYNEQYPDNWQKGNSFSITFTNTIFKAALQDHSRWKLELLIPAYLQMIERLKTDDSFTSLVKITMLSMAQPELPDLERVADTLHLTPRTLQRRLENESVTFRQISLALKKEISYLLIAHQQYSVADISLVLGFSEPASFIHSFTKWYGNTPQKFRQQITI
jgi:AraC-like DNA-binding protein